MCKPVRLLFVSLMALLPAACSNLNFYSDEQLEPLSLEAYQTAIKEHPEITLGPDYERVQRVAKRIEVASGENFKWEAKLLKADDTPNAFCLPNGRIAIYSGILPLTQTDDGLAIVMGHEVAHAVLRHGGKRMTQGTLTTVGLEAVEAGLGLSKMSPDAKAGVMAALGAGAQVGVILPYSRDNETEADIEGLRYAIRAGYKPEEAPRLWDRMAKLSGSGTPKWLSTHPPSEERSQKLREMIPVLKEQEKNWKPKPPPAGEPTKQAAPSALKK
jgi:predicted Zn-dependent protease